MTKHAKNWTQRHGYKRIVGSNGQEIYLVVNNRVAHALANQATYPDLYWRKWDETITACDLVFDTTKLAGFGWADMETIARVSDPSYQADYGEFYWEKVCTNCLRKTGMLPKTVSFEFDEEWPTTTTLTYQANKWVDERHICNDLEVPEGPTLDATEVRRGAFNSQLKDTLRPCCWNTYCTMKS